MKSNENTRSGIVRPLAAISILLLAVSSLAAGQQATISASPSVANPWDEIAVSYSGAPGFDSDWMAMYKAEATNEYYGEWYYLNGNKSGTLTFTAPNEVGSYEFRMFENWAGGGGYNDIAISNVVRVQIEPVNPVTITASPRLVVPGGSISVAYSGAPGFDSDWMAMYKAEATNEDYSEWYYLNGNESGTLTFTAPGEEGGYEFRMFRNLAGGGGYNDIARSNRIFVNSSMALGCSWESFTPDQTAFAAQPGNVFPLRENDFVAGSYLIHVGPAGKDGLDIPPSSWKTFGPYDLEGGHKYKAVIDCPGGNLVWEKDAADLGPYSTPPEGFARVYSRNDCAGDTWYAICLEATGTESGPCIPFEGYCWRVIDDLSPSEPSNWVVEGDRLRQTSNVYRTDQEYDFWQGSHVIADSSSLADYELAFSFNSDDDDGIGAIVRYQDGDNYYRFIEVQDSGNGGPFRRIEKFVDGQRTVLAEDNGGYLVGQTYQVQFRAIGDELEVWIDGGKILSATDSSFKSGTFGFLTYAEQGVSIWDIRVNGASGQLPECNWESFTPDQRAFAAQPGGVFPLRDNDFVAGSYMILVGPAGEDGLDLPPASWNTFGPYELLGGHKYKALIESPRGESLRFEEDPADLLSYSSPPAGFARVYARNDCIGDTWYAICMQLIEPEAGTGAEGTYVDPCEEDPMSPACLYLM